jgi:hypothetical protein
MTHLIPQDQLEALIPTDANGLPKYIDMQGYRNIINHEPKRHWVEVNKYAGNSKYIPIGIIEELLREIYPAWEAKQIGQPQILANSVVVSVELRVFHPILNYWLTYPGVGAVPIQVNAGASPNDWTQIKSDAMHKNVPAALSYAISNAAKKIGRLFGGHLNRNTSEL